MSLRRSLAPLRRNKYGAKPTVVDGVRFASKLEATRWQELKLLERAGKIVDLRRQVKIALPAGPMKTPRRHYIADFMYWGADSRVIEDAKGHMTKEFAVKWDWAQEEYPNWRFVLYPSRPA